VSISSTASEVVDKPRSRGLPCGRSYHRHSLHQQMMHPQHLGLSSRSTRPFPAPSPASIPTPGSVPDTSRLFPRPPARRVVPRFLCFFFKPSSSSDGGAKERTEICTTVDSGGAARFKDESTVSSVRMRPRYRILRNAPLGGCSSAQSLGQLLHTISFNSPIVTLRSNSCVRRRPETSRSVMETLEVSDIAGSGICCVIGDGVGSAMASLGAGGGTREVEGT